MENYQQNVDSLITPVVPVKKNDYKGQGWEVYCDINIADAYYSPNKL